jgi:hypothetical protein
MSDQDPDPNPPGTTRIRTEIKGWIQICIETNADIQHWFKACSLKLTEIPVIRYGNCLVCTVFT